MKRYLAVNSESVLRGGNRCGYDLTGKVGERYRQGSCELAVFRLWQNPIDSCATIHDSQALNAARQGIERQDILRRHDQRLVVIAKGHTQRGGSETELSEQNYYPG